jgi:LysM repeat protein
MGLFGGSLEDKVNQAIEKVRGQFPAASLSATVDGKVVTLRGKAQDIATKTSIMTAFNSLVETENTINQISVEQAPQAAPSVAATRMPADHAPTASASSQETTAGSSGGERTHVVEKGETLSHLAQKYYGKASEYRRIFEANRDQLSDPDKVRAGQKLRIP